jgi:tetratricopeptide (TPR) repeat protein
MTSFIGVPFAPVLAASSRRWTRRTSARGATGAPATRIVAIFPCHTGETHEPVAGAHRRRDFASGAGTLGGVAGGAGNGIALDQNNALAIRHMGHTLLAQGEAEAAIPYYEKSIRLDPRALDVFMAPFQLANCHLFLDRADEAMGSYRRARALAPGVWFVRIGLAGALGLSGAIDEAKIEIAEMVKLKPELISIAPVPETAGGGAD